MKEPSAKTQPFWDPHALLLDPVFEALAPVVKELAGGGPENSWQQSPELPSLEALQELLDRRQGNVPRSGCGIPLKVLEQSPLPRRSRSAQEDRGWEGNYQLRLFLRGEIFTRPQSWHDLFNLLVHIQFPKSKAVLNARHFWCLDESGVFPWKTRPGGNRSAEQDVLTHLDEGGVVVVSECLELVELIKQRKWHEVFWTRRQEVLQKMKFFVFGHALYEDVLKGHPTPHGLGVEILVERGFFERSSADQAQVVDQLFSEILESRDRLRHVKQCFPVPLLGYPGWCEDNRAPGYYQNETYFRPS